MFDRIFFVICEIIGISISLIIVIWVQKMSACPLQSVLADFEDACNHLEEKEAIREIMLVADSLRLGGAILGKNIISCHATTNLL